MRIFDRYSAPWAERYASVEMLELFSPQTRYSTWRQMWLWLAEAEKAVGLPITDEQLADIRAHLEDIDFDQVAEYEKELKHDVMAHIRAFGDVAQTARPIIHLGATSADITDNADLIIFRKALVMLETKIARLLYTMSKRAERYQAMACLGFTHLQPAQITTLGKRIAMWMQSLLEDLREIERLIELLPFRGIKGATGTGESFHTLLGGSYENYQKIERLCAQKAQFQTIEPITGQTYDRKWDSYIMSAMSHLAESIHKIGTDLRLLQSMHEIEEPFTQEQVGSSAMSYKRNPVKCERACSLAKFVMSLYNSAQMVTATQWMERSLDDSACRRVTMPQAFLACDSMLIVMIHIFDGLLVYPKIIEHNLKRELPFLTSERILMMAVKNGADRQEVHEILRRISMQAHISLMKDGVELDFLDLVSKEKELHIDRNTLRSLMNPQELYGFADIQTNTFLNQHVEPLLNRYQCRFKNTSFDLI